MFKCLNFFNKFIAILIWQSSAKNAWHRFPCLAILEDLAVLHNGIYNQNLLLNWGLVSWWRHLKFKSCRCQKPVSPPRNFKISWRKCWIQQTYLPYLIFYHNVWRPDQGSGLGIAWATAGDAGLCGSPCPLLCPCGELLTSVGRYTPEARAIGEIQWVVSESGKVAEKKVVDSWRSDFSWQVWWCLWWQIRFEQRILYPESASSSDPNSTIIHISNNNNKLTR